MNKSTKNTILVVTIVVVIVTLLIMANNKSSYFNKIELPNDNEVYNRTNQSYMDTIILVGLSELRIEGVAVLIQPFSSPPIGPEGMELNAFIRRYSHTKYLIEIGEFGRSDVMNILSHELLHLHQYYTHRLYINSTSVRWYDKVYTDDIPDYLDRPWEIEAEGLGRILNQKMKKKLYK